ncbi:MAG: hypothetical protein ABIP36_05635 [Acidimicrobiales bacterium]
MSECCNKHPHEIGVAHCRRCGSAWCSTCLVYAFGPKKPPFCMSCAMVAGGVRTASALPALSKRQLKAQAKARAVEAKAAARAAEDAVGAEAPSSGADGGTDWATPWWEDGQPTLAESTKR